MVSGSKKIVLISFLILVSTFRLYAEDGSDLWLRFKQTVIEKDYYSGIVGRTGTISIIEFQTAWKEMCGTELKSLKTITGNSLVIGTLNDSSIHSFRLSEELKALGNEGYIIRTLNREKQRFTVVASASDKGLLYGIYHLLRIIRCNKTPGSLNIIEKPSYALRILNHWDNPDGSVERGYAGHSIFWRDGNDSLIVTEKDKAKWKKYARVNASIGINGTVLNNVNASPKMLSGEYLQRVKAIAEVLRPYCIKTYLSINFSSPAVLGGLKTSDPLDKGVINWWNAKTKEIYKLIPDFGGFLVKANSEGLPGPQDFGRTHAEGANMLADALKPYNGIVMWRAFVYNPGEKDRAKQAYCEFLPLDGQFRDNVIIQVKNGPIDFQPREPFSPLFGAMKKTAVMPEFQITQEYLGQSVQLVFLAPLWEECLQSDTYQMGTGSTVAHCTDGSLYSQKHTAIAGVANIGLDSNWCGHQFAQANWYAFGRLAWNNNLTSEQIADEWLKLTFSHCQTGQLNDEKTYSTDWLNHFLIPVKQMMLQSREAAVNYMMPLGIHHIFAGGHHYGPEPWYAPAGVRADWTPAYFHQADSMGMGFDRSHSGSNAISQYHEPLCSKFDRNETCPEIFLLWFHHVPWTYKMKNNRTLWDELCHRYDSGVQQVRLFQKIWDQVQIYVDMQRFIQVQNKLRNQSHDAQIWKDACMLYFQTFSRLPVPTDIEQPVYNLNELKKIKPDIKQHN
jgi:alpha-glucuronidase